MPGCRCLRSRFVTAALRSTLAALLHDPAATRRLGLLAVVAAALPIWVGLQAMSLPGDRAHSSAPTPPTASQQLPAKAVPAGLGQEAGLLAPLASPGMLGKAKPFLFTGSHDAREQSVACLAAAAWYEAGNDAEGQRSVIQVVLNRLNHPSFPKTVCGVVLQGSGRSTGCQFTFTCDGSLERRRPSAKSWALARQRAEAALEGAVDASVMQATHYHADYVQPWWSSQLVQLSKVGRHIFYRWPGTRGSLAGRPAMTSFSGDSTLARLGMDANGEFVGRSANTATAGVDNPRIAAAPVALQELSPDGEFASAMPATRSRSIVMALDGSLPSGRWAMEALRRCSGDPGCRVLGYSDPALAARNSALGDGQRDPPQFLLIRDASSGQVMALWDCEKAHRPDSGQCLPRQPDALRSLMRERKVS